jgi:hypothetical protein
MAAPAFRPIFAGDEVTVGRNRQVVDIFADLAIGRFEEQLNPARRSRFVRMTFAPTGYIAHDLTELCAPTGRAGKIDGVIAVMNALAAGKDSATERVPPLAKIVIGTFHFVQLDPAHRSARAPLKAGRTPVAGVGPGCIGEGKGLEPSALRKMTSPIGDEPIEKGIVSIFRKIHDPGLGIDRGGFVAEPAHGSKRTWHREAALPGRDFEYPPMVAPHSGRPGIRFFTA